MSLIRRHPVITFFVLACALSWGAIPWQSFFAPGVLVAALIVVSLTEGVAGLRAMGSRLIRWRVSWIWYLIALAVPFAVKFAAIGLNTALAHPPRTSPSSASGTACRWRSQSISSTLSTPSSLRRRASAVGLSPSCRPPGHH